MQILMGDEFFYFVENYRAVWIQGRLGGGKTSLAVIMAAHLLTQGKAERVITNFPCTFAEKPAMLTYNSVNIVDETHTFISARKGVDTYSQFLRKLGIILLMPSVLPPHYLLTKFSVQRLFNGYFAGIPIWVFKWGINYRSTQEKGYFAIWEPHHIFPFYDTRQIPFSDGGIGDGMDRTIAYERYLTYEEENGYGTLSRQVEKQNESRKTLKPIIDAISYAAFEGLETGDVTKKKTKGKAKNEQNPSAYQAIIDEIQDALEENKDNQEAAVRRISRIAKTIHR